MAGPGSSEQAPGRTVPARRAIDQAFRWGLTATLGALTGLAIGYILLGLKGIMLSVLASLFLALALEPLIVWLGRHHMPRGRAIAVVGGAFGLATAALLWLVVPFAVRQFTNLVAVLPQALDQVERQKWFTRVDELTNGRLDSILEWVQGLIGNADFLRQVGGGLLHLGVGVASAVSSGIFIVILTIYFVASMRPMKRGVYSLVPASHRLAFMRLTERIADSVGKYLSGMVVLSTCNALLTFLLLTIVGVPFAWLFALLALFITLIPLIGTIVTTAMMTVVALFTSPMAAIIVLVVMLVYMQVEAYYLTPKVMSRAVQVPGAVVLISAAAGAALLGLFGALIAVPVAAAIMTIVRAVVVPAQARR
ncbi:AI-2E family transporter [Specibacter cremeus]|uniref:AI-2E family transporter n=1 Tax=Specibacter cremeus TaxID=1629051 RepID=UPI000F78A772|nr:AI-2E family transporter [Specibacter cremeus]